MSCEEGHRCCLDPALLWLWCRLAAMASIQPLAWELPYAAGMALKRKKKHSFLKKKKNLKQMTVHVDTQGRNEKMVLRVWEIIIHGLSTCLLYLLHQPPPALPLGAAMAE